MQRSLKIGTRGSPLALYQARLVQSRLAHHAGVTGVDVEAAFPICILKTSGDRLKGDLSEFGGKGLFTKELEDALLSETVDLAVHSMKDVPTIGQKPLMIGAVLEREDPRDAFIAANCNSINTLRHGAIVGTASLRRRAQLAAIRPDVTFTLLRGNVGTRLEKLAAGDCDATFLAYAGLRRLGRTDAVTEIVDTDVMLNAPAQGAIGIEIRKADTDVKSLIGGLNHRPTELSIIAERAFLRALDGSCRTPIAALATASDETMRLRGQVLSLDGTFCVTRESSARVTTHDQSYALGEAMGRDVLKEIGERNIWDA